MRYGILGDIHANLGALRSALDALRAQDCRILLSVGDVVGYGAAPGECIALLREHEVLAVMGNHDAACVDLLDPQLFNPFARAAVAWTRERLTRAERTWLRDLPYTRRFEHCELAHGTLHEPEAFHYLLELADALPSLELMQRPVCFVGHSHIPLTVLRTTDGHRTGYTTDPELDLSGAEHALVNVGSVGQPRDENPLAACAVYDSDSHRLQIERVPYDVETEARRIERAGLPKVLAERLRLGV